jgi:hypothetical protein
VFEEVGEPGVACGFVRRADVIPEIDADKWEAVILREDHFKTVIELIALEFNFRDLERGMLGLWGLGGKRRCEDKNAQRYGGKETGRYFHGRNYLKKREKAVIERRKKPGSLD